MKRFHNLAFFLTMLSVYLPTASYACPAMFTANYLPYSKKYKFRRQNLALYIVKEDRLVQVPLQVNKGYPDGSVDYNIRQNSLARKLGRFDRISFDPHRFNGNRWNKKGPPCDADYGVEIQNRGSYGYLLFCKNAISPLEPAIHYDHKLRKVESPLFTYIHDDRNHLSFSEISLHLDGKKKLVIASSAEQLIRADVRNFFTMSFDADDIDAELAHSLPGSVGLYGLLNFYLKIFFFSIDLSLTPEVQFYRNSLFMPMSLHSPVNANKYLNKGSGIFYSWHSPKEMLWDSKASRMPKFMKKGYWQQDLSEYCHGSICTFDLLGEAETLPLKMSFSLSRSLAEQGFFPQLFTDMNMVEEAFGTSISEDDARRMGVYFETSKLPKGDHFWDFWIRMGNVEGSCPANVTLRPMKL